MSTITDSLGRIFDPQKFRNAQDKLGRWINARAGRKRKPRPGQTSFPAMNETTPTPAPEKSAAPSAPPPPSDNPPPAPAAAAPEEPGKPQPAPLFDDIEAAARAGAPAAEAKIDGIESPSDKGTPTAETIIGIIQTALVLIGEEEGILTEAEKMLLRPPLQRVLKKYEVGSDVLPPEVDMAVALAGLVITRLKKPKTARFAAKVRAWVVNLWLGRKGREIQRVVTREASQ